MIFSHSLILQEFISSLLHWQHGVITGNTQMNTALPFTKGVQRLKIGN